MFNLGSIQQAWTLSLLFGAGMGSVLVLRWLWERINLFSEIAAILASLICAPIILQFIEADWMQLLTMAIVTTLIAVGVTYFTPSTSNERLDEFYKRVKPSGFWRGAASRNGDDASLPIRKLQSSLKQTIITAISLFTLLVGFGKLMFRPSSESIWLTLLLIAIGLALIPFWYKTLNDGDDAS